MLLEARVELIDLDLCNSTQWYNGRVMSTNVCAGYPEGKIDTCQVTLLRCQTPGSLQGSPDPEDFFFGSLPPLSAKGSILVTPSLVPSPSVISSHNENWR